MTVSLDFKNPTLVMVGNWNPSILNNPIWVAKHLMDIPEGTDIEINVAVMNDGLTTKQVHLFDNIGVSCTESRLEFFSNSEASEEHITNAVRKICEILPHTPISAVGINFHFTLTEDDASSGSSLTTEEVLDEFGDIKILQRKDTLVIAEDAEFEVADAALPPTVLNVDRMYDFSELKVACNYHRDIDSMATLKLWAAENAITHWQSHAQELLNSCYGAEKYTKIGF